MMNFVDDERGAFFVFGPLWFVILVVILAFIFGAIRNNSNNSTYRNSSLYPRSRAPIKNTSNKSNGLLLYNGIQCLNCLTMNSKDARYCQNCGTRID